MLRTSALFVLLLFIANNTFAKSKKRRDKDSTGSADIRFVKLEAIVSDKIIHFKWDVNTERRGNHFIIEKSIDEKHWTALARIESIKNHQQNHTYQLSQINLIEGAYEHFRLIRVDQNGLETELDRVNINHPVLTNLLLIPTRNSNKEFVISYSSMLCSDGKIEVRDMNNTVVFKDKVHFNEGYNRLVLDTKNFEKGEYIVTVRDEYKNTLCKTLKIQTLKERKTKF